MLTDRHEQELAQILNAGLPAPGPGCESRVLAALADIRPRRHPNLLTYIIVTALILLLAAGLFAAVRYFFVDGTLLFISNYASSLDPHFESDIRVLAGELEWQVDEVWHGPTSDISAATGEMLFVERDGNPPRPRTGDIIKAKLDGSDPVNLTQRAALGGVNCKARWSPDRSMIAFQHCDPEEDMEACEAGWHVWVMNADGTGARRVIPEGIPSASETDVRWSPDGSRLICGMDRGGHEVVVTMDIWGQDVRVIPNAGHYPAWSPDGSMIASCIHEEEEMDGESGVRWALLVTNTDGSDPRILVEQFIATADVEARYRSDPRLEPDGSGDTVADIQWWAGPRYPEWSPAGDKIAFLAALPFDPDRPCHRCQIEVWVYDLTTDELIRVTDDDVEQNNLHWK